jgi:hypothetical protein
MTRETKLNLIFVAILIPLLIPGAVILVQKKLREGERMMYLPPPLYTSAAYNDWGMTRPGIERIEPPAVTEWVKQILGERYAALLNIRPPQAGIGSISRGRRFEVLWARPLPHEEAERLRATVLWWAAADEPSVRRLQWSVDDIPVQATRIERLEPPSAVRRALQDVGYVRPPEWIWWIEMEAQAAVSPANGFGGRSIVVRSEDGTTVDRWTAEDEHGRE